MVKTRKSKVKSIENEEIIVAMTMKKITITKIIIILMMRMRTFKKPSFIGKQNLDNVNIKNKV